MSDLVRPIALLLSGAVIFFVLFMGSVMWFGNWYRAYSYALPPISNGFCNVAVIPIQGEIIPYDNYYATLGDEPVGVFTSGDWMTRYLRDAEWDSNILGAVIQIDSGGGFGAASIQMMNAIKYSPLPMVAYIREVGASGAYLAATGADVIIASPFATVGSIGVTYSYVENVEKNRTEGLNFVELASGPYKDTGNPNKPLSAEERALFERDIDIFNDVFISFVAENRGLLKEEVQRLADGSSMPASLALERGLIDQVGDESAIRSWFAAQNNLPPEEIVLCN